MPITVITPPSNHPRLLPQLIPELSSSGALVGTEGLLLQQLIEEKHHIVRAAWEVYEVDPNVEELMETLVHVVKLEKVGCGGAGGGTGGAGGSG